MSMVMSTVVLLTSSMATASENVDERWNLLVDAPFGGSCEFASLRSLLGKGAFNDQYVPTEALHRLYHYIFEGSTSPVA